MKRPDLHPSYVTMPVILATCTVIRPMCMRTSGTLLHSVAHVLPRCRYGVWLVTNAECKYPHTMCWFYSFGGSVESAVPAGVAPAPAAGGVVEAEVGDALG